MRDFLSLINSVVQDGGNVCGLVQENLAGSEAIPEPEPPEVEEAQPKML